MVGGLYVCGIATTIKIQHIHSMATASASRVLKIPTSKIQAPGFTGFGATSEMPQSPRTLLPALTPLHATQIRSTTATKLLLGTVTWRSTTRTRVPTTTSRLLRPVDSSRPSIQRQAASHRLRIFSLPKCSKYATFLQSINVSPHRAQTLKTPPLSLMATRPAFVLLVPLRTPPLWELPLLSQLLMSHPPPQPLLLLLARARANAPAMRAGARLTLQGAAAMEFVIRVAKPLPIWSTSVYKAPIRLGWIVSSLNKRAQQKMGS